MSACASEKTWRDYILCPAPDRPHSILQRNSPHLIRPCTPSHPATAPPPTHPLTKPPDFISRPRINRPWKSQRRNICRYRLNLAHQELAEQWNWICALNFYLPPLISLYPKCRCRTLSGHLSLSPEHKPQHLPTKLPLRGVWIQPTHLRLTLQDQTPQYIGYCSTKVSSYGN